VERRRRRRTGSSIRLYRGMVLWGKEEEGGFGRLEAALMEMIYPIYEMRWENLRPTRLYETYESHDLCRFVVR